MTPESSYLRALVRAFVAAEKTVPPPPSTVRWSRLRALLLGHHMVPALPPLIPPGAVPDGLAQELESVTRTLRLRTGLLLHELSRILPALEAAGLRPVVLKGAALAHTVYANPEDRSFLDLDVLVRRERIDEACAILRSFGFEPREDPRSAAFFERHHFHRILRKPSGVTVEVHWDLSRPSDYFRFDLDGWLKRSRLLDAGGMTMRTPSGGDQLLHAASQALGERFSGLRRVLDAALLLRCGAGDDPGLVERARSQGLATALWVLLELAREITEVEAPTGLERGLRPRRAVRSCLASLRLSDRAVALDGSSPEVFKSLLRWLCAPNPLRALAEVGRFVFPGEMHFLEAGYPPGNLPGPARRALLSVRRSGTVVRIASHQLGRLVSRPPRVAS